MKLSVVILLIVSSFFTAYSQNNYVVTVYVKYGFKKSKITPEVQVNLGNEDINHPLFGKLKNSGETCVSIRENGSEEEIICNEVDLFEFLFDQNWELKGTSDIKVLATPYTQYIFVYKE